MQIKTSDLIQKLISASEQSCKCEDENLTRMLQETFSEKDMNEFMTFKDVAKLSRICIEYSRFTSVRTVCKVLQDLGVAENDIDVMNNEIFRDELSKYFI